MATWDLSTTCAHVLICNGSSCLKKQGEEMTVAIREALTEQGLDDRVHTARTRCQGRCKDAPTVIVYPEGTWYQKLTTEEAGPLAAAIGKGERLLEKVSHTFNGLGFDRHNDAPVGIKKTEEKLKAVSK
ncbi:(2Fe-2S) ferredoxin domain-containing protein [Sporosarcina sp. 179-K 3D1 HS]|uniref:(2Fe-2S) ferredoxin domain-containing protein n=1 Tax=Sporosarcina sp. 179-K 3D1 HS TaxID=3232169 RepID=UPI0039A35D29